MAMCANICKVGRSKECQKSAWLAKLVVENCSQLKDLAFLIFFFCVTFFSDNVKRQLSSQRGEEFILEPMLSDYSLGTLIQVPWNLKLCPTR